MYIGVTLILCSLLYTGLISAVYFSKQRPKNLENKIYNVLIFANVMCLLLELSCCVLVPKVSEYPIATLIANRLFLVFILIWVTLFTRYIFIISFENDSKLATKIKDNYKKLSYVFWAFCIVCSLLLMALPLNYYYDGNYVYSFGLSTNFLYCITAIYLIILFVCVILNIKKVSKKKFIPLLAFIVCVVIALIIRAINPGLLLITATESFVTILMYFTIENPDMKLIHALDLAKDHAEKANRAKSDFLSSMSHEVRTPLNAIVGFSECIKTEPTLEAAQKDADDILMASRNLLEIVNGILDISKIEANKMEIVNVNYELLPNLENLTKLVIPRIGDKPIELVTTFASDIPAVMHGDLGKIKQIITNILTNAVKYTEKGRIEFTVNCINENDSSSLVISVEDTGRGIKPEKIDTLFTKFNRLEEDRNTTTEGTGLGLAITKSLVEMMGGKIVVQSIYGQGTKFTIYLKQHIVKLYGGAKEKNIDEDAFYDFSNTRILIVDDNKLNLKLADKILKGYNIETLLTETGMQAIELIKNKEKFDLILMDDMMPRMRGTEALIRLKKIEGFSIPTVVLTANAISGTREGYLKDGFDDYLAKPIEKEELIKILLKYLKGNKADLSKRDNYEDYKGKKILIVDDNKLNIKVATNLLKPYNLNIEEVECGKACIEKILSGSNYDLIFMDDMMPITTGTETMHKLKNMNIKEPIVALTANAVEGAKENYLKEGFDEYISKPIDREKLREILRKFLVKN